MASEGEQDQSRSGNAAGHVIVYCATGDSFYLEEARGSARSLRASNPAVRIVLFTDRRPEESAPFDEVRLLGDPKRSFADKIAVLRDAPFERFLFLDGDTYVAGDVTPLFRLLDRFDLAAAHDLLRIHSPLPEIPVSFPEFNTGVLAIRRSAAVDALLNAWLELFLEHKRTISHLPTQDQPSFRRLVWDSALRVATLTPEWNCMANAGQSVAGRVVILHGKAPRLDLVARRINSAAAHPQTGELRNRWFKGQGSGWGWVRHRLWLIRRVAHARLYRWRVVRTPVR